MKYKTPDVDQLIGMLAMIAGASASAKPSPEKDLSDICFTALYVDREGEKVATCSCALPTAAALGSALSMIPVGGCEDMVDEKELTGMANDNFYEVMNIFSSLLMDDKSQHLKLTTVEPGDAERIQGEGTESQVFSLDLGNYGKGEVIFDYT